MRAVILIKVLCAFISLCSVPVNAQDVLQFDLPSGPANIALREYARQAGRQILLPRDELEQYRTRAVKGKYSVDEALTRLLAGTGLEAEADQSGILAVRVIHKTNRGENKMNGAQPTVLSRFLSFFGVSGGAAAAAMVGMMGSEAAAQEESVARRGTLEEVVVTARKREESLQDTPLSVMAMGRLELESRSITSITDLQSSIPNLSMPGAGTSGSTANSSVFIRGVGQSDPSITMDPGVGVYIDGVYRARLQGGALELMDIERIEVLRGPQGTLYGRNTIGGAINIISSRPNQEAGATLKLGAGNYNLRSASLVADLPLIDNRLYSRLSLGYTDRDGFTRNTFNGERWNDKQFVGARIMLDYFATDNLTFNLNVDWNRRDLENAGSDCVVLDRNSPLFQALDALAGYGAACEASGNGGRYDFAHDLPSLDNNEERGVALTADWELSDSLALKSITAFRRLEWRANQDVDGTDLALATNRQAPSSQDQRSQEFQLQGESFGGDLLWTAGLYYFREEAERPTYSDIFPINYLDWRYRETDNKSYAAYGQATYAINPAWSLSGGLRYTYEERYFFNEEYNLVTGLRTSQIVGEDDFDAVTPMLNLAYMPTDGLMLYASWSRGFKAGGFNARANPNSPFTAAPFDPETVDAWELGVKSSWLDNRLTVNLAVYQTDYEDIQLVVDTVSSTGDYLSLVQSAGEAVIRGVELEFNMQLTDRWRVSGGYGHTDAKYQKFDTVDTATGEIIDQSHFSFSNTPRNTFNLSSQWLLPWNAAGMLDEAMLRVDYNYNSGFYNNVVNTPELKTSSFELFNASLILSFNDHRTSLQLWGKNLTDEIYVIGALDLVESFGVGQRYFAEPRTWGVSLRHEF